VQIVGLITSVSCSIARHNDENNSRANLHNPSAGISEFTIAALLVIKLLFTVNTDDACHD